MIFCQSAENKIEWLRLPLFSYVGSFLVTVLIWELSFLSLVVFVQYMIKKIAFDLVYPRCVSDLI